LDAADSPLPTVAADASTHCKPILGEEKVNMWPFHGACSGLLRYQEQPK